MAKDSWVASVGRHETCLDNTEEYCTLKIAGSKPLPTVTLTAAASTISSLKDSHIISSEPGRVKVRVRSKSRDSAQIELEAVSEGKSKISLGTNGPWFVANVGVHRSHLLNSEKSDVLAAAANRDIGKAAAIQQMLHGDVTCIFDQLTGTYKKSTLGCAEVCRDFAEPLFGGSFRGVLCYHVPFKKKPDRLEFKDIKYPKGLARIAMKAISVRLQAGVPVIVGVALQPHGGTLGYDKDAKAWKLQPTSNGGHSVLIVATDRNNQFLYIDPLCATSCLRYLGGLDFNYGSDANMCSYMGLMYLVDGGEKGEYLHCMRGPDTNEHMEVIQGPL